jgi:hypothetical protein
MRGEARDMVRAIRQTVTIKLGGRIEVTSDQLPGGEPR